MRTHNTDGREYLYRLLKYRLGEDIPFEVFCNEVEQTWNFRVGKGELSPKEARVFEGLFDTVVWYSQFPEQRDAYPKHFKDEKAIEAAVCKARMELKIFPSE